MLKIRFIFPVLALASALIGAGGFGKTSNGRFTVGQPVTGEKGISRTVSDLMADQAAAGPKQTTFTKREFEIPGRRNRPQDPAAGMQPQKVPGISRNMAAPTDSAQSVAPHTAQTVGLQWDGVTGPNETGSFPPDSMGAAGPSQFIIDVNEIGRTHARTPVTVRKPVCRLL